MANTAIITGYGCQSTGYGYTNYTRPSNYWYDYKYYSYSNDPYKYTTTTATATATITAQQQQYQHWSPSGNNDAARRADAAIIMQGPVKLRFPDTALGDECQLRLRLCNPTHAPMKIRVRCEADPMGGSLPVSFACPVSKVCIQPRAYVMVPILFRPTVIGRHRGQALVRVSGGSHRIQVRLQGTAIVASWPV
ncbi:hypothetical protein BDF19DRAFT_412347 [Syncephalis fuscata]|nr:hypothetical protein BDF19DRAFT_412347 [Syncephalis fuscata]